MLHQVPPGVQVKLHHQRLHPETPVGKCALGVRRKTFGIDPNKIGNKSIRSSAAISLLLTRRSLDKVMILGLWKSKVFLDYIRHQVVKLTTGFLKDMVSFDTFFELCSRSIAAGENPEPLQKHYDMPRFHLGKSHLRMAG